MTAEAIYIKNTTEFLIKVFFNLKYYNIFTKKVNIKIFNIKKIIVKLKIQIFMIK